LLDSYVTIISALRAYSVKRNSMLYNVAEIPELFHTPFCLCDERSDVAICRFSELEQNIHESPAAEQRFT
jgi:hypothetical protein